MTGTYTPEALAAAVKANPSRFYYRDAAGRPRWGNKRAAKKDEIEPKIARGKLTQLVSPQEAAALGREWPVLMLASRGPVPKLEDRKPVVSRETSAEEDTEPMDTEAAEPVPNYDKIAEGEQAAELEAEEAAELEVEIDAEQMRDIVEFAADSILDMLIWAAYLGSSVSPKRPPTDKERRMWQRALTKYAAARMPEVAATPEAMLAITAGMVLAPALAHAHGDKLAAFLSGRGA